MAGWRSRNGSISCTLGICAMSATRPPLVWTVSSGPNGECSSCTTLAPTAASDSPAKAEGGFLSLEEIEKQFGPRRVKTGMRLLLEQTAAHLLGDKPKCPFIPQREMEVKMTAVPEEVVELQYEEDWQPLTVEPDQPLTLPRAWGRSSTRAEKFGGY